MRESQMLNWTRYFTGWIAKCYTSVSTSPSVRVALIGATTEEDADKVLREALHNGNERYARIELVRVLLSPQDMVSPGEVRWLGT
jgi:hypothetical protein